MNAGDFYTTVHTPTCVLGRDENGGNFMFGTTAMNSQMNAEDQKENMI